MQKSTDGAGVKTVLILAAVLALAWFALAEPAPPAYTPPATGTIVEDVLTRANAREAQRAQKEVDLRQRELDLKERELSVREKELSRSQ